ncbi:MAG: CBS domain-containing protein [Elusimicrobia bacterium]|nr:CBS domain-containing protein [Elusimicrobiota bacterium]
MDTVKDLMTSNPAFCTPDTSLQDVARMMCDCDCGEIPVVEGQQNRRPIGVITDRDIVCRSIARGKDPMQLKVKDCMTPNPVTIKAETGADQVVQLMEKHQIRRVPVVDEKGILCGIVAQADIARKEQHQAAEVLQKVSQPAGAGR